MRIVAGKVFIVVKMKSKEKQLWDLCQNFISNNDLRDWEDIFLYPKENFHKSSLDLIEDIIKIIGYHKHKDLK